MCIASIRDTTARSNFQINCEVFAAGLEGRCLQNYTEVEVGSSQEKEYKIKTSKTRYVCKIAACSCT